jgi:aryl-alcohol dehydrogenase-like predicted oxidoreductase
VRAQIRASLARLGRIDALWLHGPRPDELTPALFTACETEGAKAGVRLIGVCTRTPALIERVLADPGPVGALMAPLALDPGEALPAWVDRAHDQGMGVFAIEALARAQRKSPWPPRRGADVWHLARAMKRRALGHLSPEASLAPETALQTVLSRPQVTCTLVTTTRPHHLHTNLAVAQRNS